MKAKLRPGNVYTSDGVVDVVEPLIKHYNEKFPEIIPFLRGDSGFAVPAVRLLRRRIGIRLKSNAILLWIADELHPFSLPLMPATMPPINRAMIPIANDK